MNTRRNFILLFIPNGLGMFLVLFSALALYGQTLPQDRLLGTYWTPDKDGKVEFIRKGNTYAGKLIQADHLHKDIHNPDPARRNDSNVGAEFIKGLVFDGDDLWENGTIYDSRTGKTYRCDVTRLENGDLKIRGYVGISLLGQSVVFYKIR